MPTRHQGNAELVAVGGGHPAIVPWMHKSRPTGSEL